MLSAEETSNLRKSRERWGKTSNMSTFENYFEASKYIREPRSRITPFEVVYPPIYDELIIRIPPTYRDGCQRVNLEDPPLECYFVRPRVSREFNVNVYGLEHRIDDASRTVLLRLCSLLRDYEEALDSRKKIKLGTSLHYFRRIKKFFLLGPHPVQFETFIHD